VKIYYKKGLLQICEIWFNKVPQNEFEIKQHGKADVLLFHESATKITENSRPFKNGIIRLDQDQDKIFANFNKDLRNIIRRAEKENVKCAVDLSPNAFNNVFTMYLEFCLQKRIQNIDYKLLESYNDQGRLLISKAFIDRDEKCFHIYLKGEDEMILLASFTCGSGSGQIKGMCNRMLHWFDILLAKQSGTMIYNLGGMGNPVTDQNKSIVSFKKEMSPSEVFYYQDIVATSNIGRCYKVLKHLKLGSSLFPVGRGGLTGGG
jgi:hypothetical protein